MTVVVVEGMDFAGKSTVCRIVAGLLADGGLQPAVSRTSLARGPMSALIGAVYRAPLIPDLARSLAYHLCYLPDLLARTPPGAGCRVLVQESYICRVLAYDRARGRRRLAWLAGRLSARLHRRVDVGVLLECPYEVRRERYAASGITWRRDDRRFSARRRQFDDRLSAELSAAARRAGYVVVPSAGHGAGQVAAEIARLVLARRRAAVTGGGRAWPVQPGLYLAGGCARQWQLGMPPAAVVCLRRRRPRPGDYGPDGLRLRVLHRPFPYWELPDPLGVLGRLAAETSELARSGTVVVHCALGLDRAAVLGLAVLILAGLDLGEACARYALRGVRPPRADALSLVAVFAARRAGGVEEN